MKSITKLFFIALLAIAISSCGVKKSSQHAVSNNKADMTEEEFKQFQKDRIFKGSIRDTDNKSFGVGVLSVFVAERPKADDPTKIETEYNLCTATLLEGGIVISAAHCLPDDLRNKKNYKKCSKIAFLHADEKEEFACSEILWSSTELDNFKFSELPTKDGVYADVLILKLAKQPTQIKSLTLSETFAENNQNYKTWLYAPTKSEFSQKDLAKEKLPVVDFIQQGMEFFFRASENCQMVDQPAPGFPYRMFNCPIIEGNSGGPVLNKENKIQGIVGGFIRDGKIGYMTDTGCLERKDNHFSWKKSCPVHSYLSNAN